MAAKKRSDLDIAGIYFSEDFEMPPFMAFHELDERNFWVGPGGIISRLHHDSSENILAMVAGSKRCVLFPPSSKKMYGYQIKTRGHFSQVNIDNWDKVRFPDFPINESIVCEVHAGDMLFIPSHWWHQIYSTGRNIALNFWFSTHNFYKKVKVAAQISIWG